MSRNTRNESAVNQADPTDWRQRWTADLRYYHATERELSDVVRGGEPGRRAALHLRLCVSCRERLAFEIEGAVLERSREPGGLGVLDNLLSHGEAVVRASAARAAVSLADGHPAVVRRLSALRDDVDQLVRNDAAFAWDALGPDDRVAATPPVAAGVHPSDIGESRARLGACLGRVRYAAGLAMAAAAPLHQQSEGAVDHVVITEDPEDDLRISVSSYDRTLEGTRIHVDPFDVSFTLERIAPGEVCGQVIVPRTERADRPRGATVRLRVDAAPEQRG